MCLLTGADGFKIKRIDNHPEVRPQWGPNSGAGPLIALCNRPYWSRLWIIQEILLAEQVLICCGSMACSWALLKEVVYSVDCRFLAYESKIVYDLVRYRDDLQSKRIRGDTGSKWDQLDQLITTFVGSFCEEPRDMVYAVLSLMNEPSNIAIDYSKSVEEVFEETVQQISKTGFGSRRFILGGILTTLWFRLEVDLFKIENRSIQGPGKGEYGTAVHVRQC